MTDELTRWHDRSLDWADPRDPNTWSAGERTRFDQAAEEVRAAIQAELGAEFDVVYEPL